MIHPFLLHISTKSPIILEKYKIFINFINNEWNTILTGETMFNKRPDGRAIQNLEPMQMIMPYIMKTRTDSMNMYEDSFACEPWDAYIKEKAAEGISFLLSVF